MTFVLDASVTMAWCFEDEATAATEAVLDRLAEERALVPALWRLEVANVLVVAARRGRVTDAQSGRFVTLLERLPIAVDDTPPPIGTLVDAAHRYGISAYDAAYFTLALDSGHALATVDTRLVAAASAAGVALVVDPTG